MYIHRNSSTINLQFYCDEGTVTAIDFGVDGSLKSGNDFIQATFVRNGSYITMTNENAKATNINRIWGIASDNGSSYYYIIVSTVYSK